MMWVTSTRILLLVQTIPWLSICLGSSTDSLVPGEMNIHNSNEDLEKLNTALSIENLKLSLLSTPQANAYAQQISKIKKHTQKYVDHLSSTIREAGGQPNEKCSFRFDRAGTGLDYLTLVRTLGTVGLQTYVGLVSELAVPKHRLVLAGIAATQGRHLAYLNQLAGVDPYPEESEDALSTDQALTFLQGWTSNCKGLSNIGHNKVRDRAFRRLSLYPTYGPPGTMLTYTMPYLRNMRRQFDHGLPSSNSSSTASNRHNNSTSSAGEEEAEAEDRLSIIRRPYCAFIYSRRQFFVQVYSRNTCRVPREANLGLVKVFITNMRRRVTTQYDGHIIAGPAFFDVRGGSISPYPISGGFPDYPDVDEMIPGDNGEEPEINIVNNGIIGGVDENMMVSGIEQNYPPVNSYPPIVTQMPQPQVPIIPNPSPLYPISQPVIPMAPSYPQPIITQYPQQQIVPQYPTYPQQPQYPTYPQQQTQYPSPLTQYQPNINGMTNINGMQNLNGFPVSYPYGKQPSSSNQQSTGSGTSSHGHNHNKPKKSSSNTTSKKKQ